MPSNGRATSTNAEQRPSNADLDADLAADPRPTSGVVFIGRRRNGHLLHMSAGATARDRGVTIGAGPRDGSSSMTSDRSMGWHEHGSELDIESVMDLADIIASLQDLSDEELNLRGLAVDGTWDEVDDPVLLGPDGHPVDTWREGYPYDERMTRSEYELTKRLLQIELLKLQAHVKATGLKLCLLFEGRDAAGKGGTIKRFMEHLNPRGANVVALTKPTPIEAGQWYFQRYMPHLPSAGEIVLFDRSWYNRAGVERVMGFCTDDEYEEFMRQAPQLEDLLVRSGIILF
jgi:hypothetical protein